MSTETQAVAQSFYAVYNEQKPELLNQILADSYVGHVNGHDIVGAESAKGFINAFLSAFPDTHYTVEDMVDGGGNKVVTRWTCTGTHQGAFFGIEPTNKKVVMIGITIFEVIDGKITQLWNNWDVFGLMNQLKG
jgi:steroid delta-isomerase-like uncharacterized protein